MFPIVSLWNLAGGENKRLREEIKRLQAENARNIRAREESAQREAQTDQLRRNNALELFACGGLTGVVQEANTNGEDPATALLREIDDAMSFDGEENDASYFDSYGTTAGMSDVCGAVGKTTMSGDTADFRTFNPDRLNDTDTMVFCRGAFDDDALFDFLVTKLFGEDHLLEQILAEWSPRLQKLRLAYLRSKTREYKSYTEDGSFHPVFVAFANAFLSAAKSACGDRDLVRSAARPATWDDHTFTESDVRAAGQADVKYGPDGMSELEKPVAD